ncbi:MAG: hypothetical protein Q9160_002248 [Pyrenula sp. 1 TL-2023]
MQTIHSAKANIKKGEWYKTLDIGGGAPSVQMVIDKQEHINRRRLLHPAFSQRALEEAEKLIAVHAHKLTDAVIQKTAPGEWASPTNLGDRATHFGFDFVSDLGYGHSFDMLSSADNRWVPTTLKIASRFIYYSGYLPFARLIRPFLGTRIQILFGGRAAADSFRYTQLANKHLAHRVGLEEKLKAEKLPSRRKDTFHYLLNSYDGIMGRPLTKYELQADSALLIAAGSDAVGLTLSATAFYLLRSPDALQHLTTEIREAFTDVSQIHGSKLANLPYLSACLDETMRLCPPKPSTLPREVLEGGMVIDGEVIPKGIEVGTPVYVLHRDRDIYPDPWSWNPDRWLETGEQRTRAREAFCPFLIGPLNCIGKNMAYIALKCALAELLWRCDVRPAEEGIVTGGGSHDLEEGRQRKDEYQMYDWILGFRDGPMIEVRERA